MRFTSVVCLLCASAAVGSAQVGEVSLSFGDSIFKDNILGSAADLSGVTQFKMVDGFRITARLTLHTKKVIRLDARDYVTTKPFDLPGKSGALHQIELSAGLGLYF